MLCDFEFSQTGFELLLKKQTIRFYKCVFLFQQVFFTHSTRPFNPFVPRPAIDLYSWQGYILFIQSVCNIAIDWGSGHLIRNV